MTGVFRKSGSRHGPDFFRHEAAGLAWLGAAPGGPRVVEVLEVDDDEMAATLAEPDPFAGWD